MKIVSNLWRLRTPSLLRNVIILASEERMISLKKSEEKEDLRGEVRLPIIEEHNLDSTVTETEKDSMASANPLFHVG